MKVNLLPASLQQRMLVRRQIARWRWVWLACVIGGLLFGAQRYAELRREQRMLEAVQHEAEPLRQIAVQSQAYEVALQQSASRADRLHSLKPVNSALAVLSIVSQAANRCGGEAQVEQVTFREREQFAKKPVAANPTQTVEQASLIIRGAASHDQAVAAFVDALRLVHPSGQVELNSSTQHRVGESDMRRFEVEWHF
jgi:hypothetical protein